MFYDSLISSFIYVPLFSAQSTIIGDATLETSFFPIPLVPMEMFQNGELQGYWNFCLET